MNTTLDIKYYQNSGTYFDFALDVLGINYFVTLLTNFLGIPTVLSIYFGLFIHVIVTTNVVNSDRLHKLRQGLYMMGLNVCLTLCSLIF